MHMAENFDISTLTWVKGEIDETLKQARVALEAYVEDTDDEAQLRFCTTYLHQVSGTLRMVELNGAAQFADEMEQFAVGLLEGNVGQSDEAFEMLMRAILQLPYYLEGLQHGQADNPLVLLPVMNELREKRGAGRLSEAVFFRPDLSIKAPGGAAENAPAIDELVHKLRPYLQTAILNILRDRELDKAFKAIELVFDKLLQTATGEDLRQWLWVGAGYVEALQGSYLTLNKHAKTLLGKFDQILRNVAADGEGGVNVTLLHEMVRALLYQLAKVDGGGQRVQALKTAFSLERYLPSVQTGIKGAMGGIDEELRKAVAADVMEEMTKVKDSLDIFVRSDRKEKSSLDGMALSLSTMAETLKLLGEEKLSLTIREQAGVLRKVIDGSTDASDETMMGVAGAVLAVESALGEWGTTAPLEKADDYAGQVSEEETSPEASAEHNRVIRQVMKETKDDLIKIREAISQYLQNPQDKSVLEGLPVILHQSIGSLAMLSYRRVASVLQSCSAYIRERLIESEQIPESEQLDSLADAIMSIEYYLEAFVQSKVHPSSVLEVAEQSVEKLGYPAGAQAVAEVEPIVVEAPEFEPEEPSAAAEEAVESAIEFEPVHVEPEEAQAQAEEQPLEVSVPIAAAAVAEGSEESAIDEEILEIFIEEATEEFEKIAEYLPKWRANTSESETLLDLRRCYHTLKGSGRLVGASELGEFAWAFENLLNRIIDGSVPHNNVVFDILQESQEAFVQLLEQFKGGPAPTADIEMLREAAEELSVPGGMRLEAAPAAAAAPAEVAIEAPAAEELQELSLDPVLLEIYANETEGHLEALDEFVGTARAGGTHKISEPLIRALHTLTGSSRMAGIAYVGDITSVLEKYAKTLQGNAKSIDEAGLGILAETSQFIKDVLAHLQDNTIALPARDTLKAEVDELYLAVEHMAEMAMAKPEEGLAQKPEQEAPVEAAIVEAAEEAIELEGFEVGEGEELTGAEAEEAIELGGFEVGEGEALAGTGAEEAIELEGFEVEEGAELAGAEAEEAIELEGFEVEEVVEPAGVEAEEAIELEGFEVEEVVEPAGVEAEEAIELEGFEVEEGEALAGTGAEEAIELEGFEVSEGEQPAATDSAVSAAVVPEYDEDLLDIFLDEGREILDASEETLQAWVDSPDDMSLVQALQRQLHTLKGCARMAGVAAIGDLSHSLESAFEDIVEGRFERSKELFDLLQLAHDRLAGMLEQVSKRQVLTTGDDLIAQINALLTGEVVEEVEAEEVSEVAPNEAAASAEELELPIEVAESAFEAEITPIEIAQVEEEPTPVPAEVTSLAEEEPGLPEAPVEHYAEQPEYDEDLLPIFLEEAEEILNNSEVTLQSWIDNPADRSLVESLQRQLHTLKGGARMAGIAPIGDLSHSLESTFEGVVEGRLQRSKSMFDLLQQAHDRLATMLEQVRRHEPLTSGDDLVERVNALAQLSEAAAVEAQAGALEVEEKAVTELTEGKAEPTEAETAAPPAVAEGKAPAPAATPFLKNGKAYLDSIRWFIQSWEREQNNTRLLDNLLQSLRMFSHSARDAEVAEFTTVVDAISQVLIGIKDGHIGISNELFSRLHLMHEQFTVMFDELANGQPLRNIKELADGFTALKGEHLIDIAPAGTVEQTETEARAESKKEQERRQGSRAQHEMVRVRSDLLDNMVNFAGEVSIYRSRVEQQLGAFRFNLDEMDQTIERLRDQIRKFDIETEAQIESRFREAEALGHEEFDPLEFDRFTSMQQISRSMMESLSDLSSIEDMLLNLARESETLLLQQSRVTTELQESLVHTRMVQLVENAPRLRRIVRQTCVDMQKDATVRFQGAEVEMDRTVVERLLAPLEHMLRNAVAHGIESKQARQAAGKPETGTIVIAQSREGSEIVVKVMDDGGGINLDGVRKKAQERGLIKPGHEPNDKELMQFILESGFSTAESLTQVSGRGVGMDVVNSELKQIGATMIIDSEFGRGTTFTIRIPLTLSVSRALTVAVGEDIYAIPLMGIQGIERLEVGEIGRRLKTDNPTFEWVGQEYRLVYLNQVLGLSGANIVSEHKKLSLLLTQSGDLRMAFAVDGLLGSREIVVKSLGSQLSTLHNLSGATILADGSVALILDIPSLIRSGTALQAEVAGEEVEEKIEEVIPTVMVVDDSITVRKVTERLLKRNNMHAITAKDGVDALAMLQEVIPDVMLLDIEMPRMDGFELASHVRKSERLKDIPIIMITSRTGEKHRQRGLEIGVNVYMGKPFTEPDLLENIQRLLAERAGAKTGE